MRKGVWMIADAHGIEGFDIASGNVFGALIRANANRHRHAILVSLDLSEKNYKKVWKFIRAGKFIAALDHVKKSVRKYGIPEGGHGFKNSWELIPNPKLDPYGGGHE